MQAMTDMAYLSSGSWINECFLSREETECDLLSRLPFDALDVDGIKEESMYPYTLESEYDLVGSQPNSSDVSNANSECSEELTVEIGDLEDCVFWTRGPGALLTSAAIGITEQDSRQLDNLTASLTFGLEDSSDNEDSTLFDDSSEEINPGSMQQGSMMSHRKWSLLEMLSHKTTWSTLSTTEQLNLAENISSVVSKYLGLREQLEVIRIISPHSSISPTDTQFVIDTSRLSDTKLLEVQQYIKHHLHSSTISSSQKHHRNSESGFRKVHKSHQHGNRAKKFCCDDRGYIATDEEYESQKKRGLKRLPQVRREEQRRETQKRNKQEKREKRSGLFVKEQILSVVANEETEDEEIDVLT